MTKILPKTRMVEEIIADDPDMLAKIMKAANTVAIGPMTAKDAIRLMHSWTSAEDDFPDAGSADR